MVSIETPMTTPRQSPQSPLAIVLNGEVVTTRAQTLLDLVSEVGLSGARIATAVNGAFIKEMQRSEVVLRARDRVEIVSPRQGG